jgi:uncharacterized protein (TIGR03089 family)
MQLISQRLRRRTSAAGGDPLITYYDLGTGERTELSAVTVSNWVDKTCYLLADEYGLDIGDLVLLDVARTHPGHWVTACLELACWRLGLTVVVDDGAGSVEPDARLVVAGPVYQACIELATQLGADLLACSLHPLGLPFAERVPEGVADYALEVRGQPDQFSAVPVPADQPAWRSAEVTLTQLELDATPGSDRRVLLRPSTAWATARAGVVAALVGGGSVVIVVGEDAAGLERIRDTENISDELA